jgi:hypothetical protein
MSKQSQLDRINAEIRRLRAEKADLERKKKLDEQEVIRLERELVDVALQVDGLVIDLGDINDLD